MKHERFERMLQLQNGIGYEINRQYVGRTVRVLCDGPSKNDPDTLSGRTDGGKNVCFTGVCPAGGYADVRITDARPFVLMGEEKTER